MSWRRLWDWETLRSRQGVAMGRRAAVAHMFASGSMESWSDGMVVWTMLP